nr:hypothetical protein [Tolivirales sp.]
MYKSPAHSRMGEDVRRALIANKQWAKVVFNSIIEHTLRCRPTLLTARCDPIVRSYRSRVGWYGPINISTDGNLVPEPGCQIVDKRVVDGRMYLQVANKTVAPPSWEDGWTIVKGKRGTRGTPPSTPPPIKRPRNIANAVGAANHLAKSQAAKELDYAFSVTLPGDDQVMSDAELATGLKRAIGRMDGGNTPVAGVSEREEGNEMGVPPTVMVVKRLKGGEGGKKRAKRLRTPRKGGAHEYRHRGCVGTLLPIDPKWQRAAMKMQKLPSNPPTVGCKVVGKRKVEYDPPSDKGDCLFACLNIAFDRERKRGDYQAVFGRSIGTNNPECWGDTTDLAKISRRAGLRFCIHSDLAPQGWVIGCRGPIIHLRNHNNIHWTYLGPNDGPETPTPTNVEHTECKEYNGEYSEDELAAEMEKLMGDGPSYQRAPTPTGPTYEPKSRPPSPQRERTPTPPSQPSGTTMVTDQSNKQASSGNEPVATKEEIRKPTKRSASISSRIPPPKKGGQSDDESTPIPKPAPVKVFSTGGIPDDVKEAIKREFDKTDFGMGPKTGDPTGNGQNDNTAVAAYACRKLNDEDLGSGSQKPGWSDKWFGGVIGYWANSDWVQQQLIRQEVLDQKLMVSEYLLAECKSRIILSPRNALSAMNTRMALVQAAKHMGLDAVTTNKVIEGTLLAAMSVGDDENVARKWLEYCPRVKETGMGFLSGPGEKKGSAPGRITRSGMWAKTFGFGLLLGCAATAGGLIIWYKVSGPSNIESTAARTMYTYTTVALPTSSQVCSAVTSRVRLPSPPLSLRTSPTTIASGWLNSLVDSVLGVFRK